MKKIAVCCCLCVALVGCSTEPVWKKNIIARAEFLCRGSGGVVEIDKLVDAHVECGDGSYFLITP